LFNISQERRQAVPFFLTETFSSRPFFSKKTWKKLPRGKAFGFLTTNGVLDPTKRRIGRPAQRGWVFIEGSVTETGICFAFDFFLLVRDSN